jgi:ABC-type lipopolysaccharide export system ATPase subunit
MPQLEADSILLNFGNRNILSDVYLSLQTGETAGLFGSNGEGKSCLMRILYGVMEAGHKSVRVDGAFVRDPYADPGLIRYLPQHNFTPEFLRLNRVFDLYQIDYQPFEQLFPQFSTRFRFLVSDLSQGERRAMETYLIIRSPAKFILLDEPFTHISPIQVEAIKEVIAMEKQEKGFLITDHMIRELKPICDKIYFLDNGKTQMLSNLH